MSANKGNVMQSGTVLRRVRGAVGSDACADSGVYCARQEVCFPQTAAGATGL